MELIPNEGISITSIYRGLIGVTTIITLAYILSSNRRMIDWKTILIGLSSQFIIAIGVIKVDFVRKFFEIIGQGFLAIVTFSSEGSSFLFGELANSNSFGVIFVFQVLPVIIFFSALTSILYYYRIIQRVVRVFAWMLTKLLNFRARKSCCNW